MIDPNNTDAVRRVLAGLLEKLERGSGEAAAGGANNLFVLMLGQVDSEPSGSNAPEPRNPSGVEGRTLTHPGLEKFTVVEGHQTDSAPRTCFMEPGRACVNSGACEMRGY
ncbi:MAG TPA: hypothetical protein VE262_15855 [Blastocatellia bacterium]|nr:hypothetical protein [Blastocatellia bacterium]